MTTASVVVGALGSHPKSGFFFVLKGQNANSPGWSPGESREPWTATLGLRQKEHAGPERATPGLGDESLGPGSRGRPFRAREFVAASFPRVPSALAGLAPTPPWAIGILSLQDEERARLRMAANAPATMGYRRQCSLSSELCTRKNGLKPRTSYWSTTCQGSALFARGAV